jgi:glyoxylase-like metal-dependent hydrolase (beta-lactamase superfamily II)
MKMHFLSGGRLRMRARTYYPGADREAMFELPVSCTLLRHAQGNVLFDSGCHPGVVDDAAGHWGALAVRMEPLHGATDNVVAQLALAGVAADDIDAVICSHLHTDHCGCNSFFPRASVIVHAAELAAARADTDAANGYYAADWDTGQRFDELTGARDVFGDGALTLLPLPGHSPGMTVAHVVLPRDGAFVLASDAVPVAVNLDQRFAPRNSWNMELTLAGFAEIARLQADGARVIYGHDDAQWQGLRKGAEWYD